MVFPSLNLRLFCLTICSVALTSCGTYPRYLNFPFDAGGRGIGYRFGNALNTSRSELTPQITSQYIIFTSDRNGSQDVYLYDMRSRNLVLLPGLNALNEIASDPSISKDGRYIVFTSNLEGKSTIYLYDRETQQKRNLSAAITAEVRNPTISANGEVISFEIGTDGQWDIYLCDRQGRKL